MSDHTIFAPADIPADLQLPIIVWGQTGCSHDGLRFEAFLIEVASHGVIVLANGVPGGQDNPNGIGETGNPDSSLHLAALDWITAGEGVQAFATADTSRIAVAGQSCGGIQAYSVHDDERVTAIGIFNSGMLDASSPIPSTVTKPIFYFLGGPSDIAYSNVGLSLHVTAHKEANTFFFFKGERDYVNLPAETPKWKGNLPLGHMADYLEANGGKFGVAASNWAKWILRGDETGAAYFLEGGAEADGWEAEHASLEALEISSLD